MSSEKESLGLLRAHIARLPTYPPSGRGLIPLEHGLPCFAEVTGFEPAVKVNPHSALAGQRLKPDSATLPQRTTVVNRS